MARMLVALAIVLGFASSAAALVLAPAPPEPQSMNGIRYLSGGVGKEERARLEVTAKDYDLKLTFTSDRGNLIADVAVAVVRIADGRRMVDVVSTGPWFFADLPAGEYRVTASALDRTFERVVRIGQRGQTTIAFTGWPLEDQFSSRRPAVAGR